MEIQKSPGVDFLTVEFCNRNMTDPQRWRKSVENVFIQGDHYNDDRIPASMEELSRSIEDAFDRSYHL